MRQLAQLTSETVRHMVSMPLGGDGLPAGLSGQLDGLNAIDTGAPLLCCCCAAAAPVLLQCCAAAVLRLRLCRCSAVLLRSGGSWLGWLPMQNLPLSLWTSASANLDSAPAAFLKLWTGHRCPSPTIGCNAGLACSFKPLYDSANSVAASIVHSRALLGVVGTEWNVYSGGGWKGVWAGGGWSCEGCLHVLQMTACKWVQVLQERLHSSQGCGTPVAVLQALPWLRGWPADRSLCPPVCPTALRAACPALPCLPAARAFPREAYELLLFINRAYLSSLMALLYPLQSGRLALRWVLLCGGV